MRSADKRVLVVLTPNLGPDSHQMTDIRPSLVVGVAKTLLLEMPVSLDGWLLVLLRSLASRWFWSLVDVSNEACVFDRYP